MKIIRIETIPVRVPINPELAIRSGRGCGMSKAATANEFADRG